MPPPPTTTLEAFHAALAATLRSLVPELREVTLYERLPERALVPRAMIDITSIEPDANGHLPNGQYKCRVPFSIYLVGAPNNEPAAKLAIRTLAARVCATLHGTPLRVAGDAGGAPEVIGAYYDFVEASGANANGLNSASFVEVWRVDAESVLVIGESEFPWPDTPVTFVFADGVPIPGAPGVDTVHPRP